MSAPPAPARRTLLVVGAVVVLAALSMAPGPRAGAGGPAEDLTFVGVVGGGTIVVTTTPARDAVLHVALENVSFTSAGNPACAAAVTDDIHYFDPPEPIANDEFDAGLLFLQGGQPGFEAASVTGTFIDQSNVEGVVTYVALLQSGSCVSDDRQWSASLKADAPPGPNDLVYAGPIPALSALLTITTNAERTEVTSIRLDGAQSVCTQARSVSDGEPIDIHASYQPSLPVTNGAFVAHMMLVFSSQVFDIEDVAVTGTVADDAISGSFILNGAYFNGHQYCQDEQPWTLPLISQLPPAARKLPHLQNLFLTRQGSKIPPAHCIDGSDTAVLTQALTAKVAGTDKHGDARSLGGFSFTVKYDQTKVCLVIIPGEEAFHQGMQCFIQDAVTAPMLQGVATMHCVTSGKTVSAPLPDPANRELAKIYVRPQPEVYSLAKPSNGNGQVAQLLNMQCKLSDRQGDPIEQAQTTCTDADITMRFLEGDVEPDCVIDGLDTQAVAFRWGAPKGSLLYNDRFNLEPSPPNADNDIDVNDLQFVYGRLNSTCDNPQEEATPVNPKA